jgi:predicted nucleic acid-binding protein
MTMPLSHLLDTSILSQPIKDKPLANVLDRWSDLGDEVVCTSAICLAEILQGLRDRESSKYWRRYRDLVENQYQVLPFDAAVADTFSSMAVDLRRQGRPKPTLDLMIAATVACHGLVLATLNARDFTGIPGLIVENWGATAKPGN